MNIRRSDHPGELDAEVRAASMKFEQFTSLLFRWAWLENYLAPLDEDDGLFLWGVLRLEMIEDAVSYMIESGEVDAECDEVRELIEEYRRVL